ncbi:MAG: hypothetical protein HDT30_07210 [Clostridiales bacterium]|nr:hypothetical protein [Clostridiales bacterium]
MIDGFGLNPLEDVKLKNLFLLFMLDGSWIWEDDCTTRKELVKMINLKDILS